jgi:hypothetical protein
LNDYTDIKNFGRFAIEKPDTLELTQTRLIPEKKEKKEKIQKEEEKKEQATPTN